MEASITRSLIKPTNRHFLTTLLLPKPHPLNLNLNLNLNPPHLHLRHHTPLTTLSLSNPNTPKSNPLSLFNFTPSSSTSPQSFQSNFNTPISINRFARILSGNSDKSFEWKFAIDGVNDGELGFVDIDKRPVVTVVVLGWLGSKQKHLRRYAEMYNMFGMNAVTFAASVNDVVGFDLGRRMEARIEGLSNELVVWLEEREKDGRERVLVFHTFSNTGWLA